MAAQINNRNYYDILCVERGATTKIIRMSYRRLMQKDKHHPDLGGDTATAAIINEAYAVLSNSERRAEYDTKLEIFARLAAGLPEWSTKQEPVVEPVLVLDPFRECIFCESPHGHGRTIDVDMNCVTCDSPLSIAEGLQAGSRDRRTVARIDKSQPISFYTRWPQRRAVVGQMEDVSLTGLRFSTRDDLQEGQRLKIASIALEAIAHVTNCRYERRGLQTVCVVGVSFATLRFVRSVGGFVSARV
jgi:curved DNA-binding protein CbpA